MKQEVLQIILANWFDNGEWIAREVYGRPIFIGSHNNRCSTIVQHTSFIRVFQYYDGNSFLSAFNFEMNENDHKENLKMIGMEFQDLDFSFEQKRGGLSCYTDIRQK